MSPTTTYMVETFLTLVGVVLLAVVVLYGARRLGVGRPLGPLELLGRLPLEGRRVVYVVRVGKAAFVVGGSERGLTRLGELDAATLAPLAGARASASGAPKAPPSSKTLATPTGAHELEAPSDLPSASNESFADVLARRGRGSGDAGA